MAEETSHRVLATGHLPVIQVLPGRNPEVHIHQVHHHAHQEDHLIPEDRPIREDHPIRVDPQDLLLTDLHPILHPEEGRFHSG